MAAHDLCLVAKAVVWEDTTVTLLGRVVVDASHTLQAAVQSDFSTIAYVVWSDGAVVTASTSLTVSSVIYNSYQGVNGRTLGNSIWSVDDTGFNFKTKIASTSFPTGSKTYVVEVTYTLASGDVFHGGYEVVTRDLQSQ